MGSDIISTERETKVVTLKSASVKSLQPGQVKAEWLTEITHAIENRIVPDLFLFMRTLPPKTSDPTTFGGMNIKSRTTILRAVNENVFTAVNGQSGGLIVEWKS